jgi:hypothetical protein
MLWRALRALEQGEFDKAERLYTAVLHIHPDHFDAVSASSITGVDAWMRHWR